MKKLVLLQLLLLPLGGLLDGANAEAAVDRCEEPRAMQRIEGELSAFAQRLVGFSYAQSPRSGSFPR